MHICRTNTKDVPRCPSAFDVSLCFGDNEIVDILLFGAPKSWQGEMDRQGIDRMTKTPTETAVCMEHIEMSKDFDADKKVVAAQEQKRKPCQRRQGQEQDLENKSDKGAEDFKKEAAALTKTVQDLSKKTDFNVVEPVKKRKVMGLFIFCEPSQSAGDCHSPWN